MPFLDSGYVHVRSLRGLFLRVASWEVVSPFFGETGVSFVSSTASNTERRGRVVMMDNSFQRSARRRCFIFYCLGYFYYVAFIPPSLKVLF